MTHLYTRFLYMPDDTPAMKTALRAAAWAVVVVVSCLPFVVGYFMR